MIKEIDEFLYNNDLTPEPDFAYIYYDLLFYIKYLAEKGLIDIERIINCSNEEYEEVINDEFKDLRKPFFISQFEDKHNEIFEFINNLNLDDYDSELTNYADYNDHVLEKYIKFDEFKDMLSIFGCIRNKNIHHSTNVDVIYETHQDGDMESEYLRCQMLGLDNYSFKNSVFPTSLKKKYDFVYLECAYGGEGLLDKFLMTDDGKISYYIFDSILEHLNNDRKAAIRIPFARISEIIPYAIEQNVIEKIIYSNPRIDFYKEEPDVEIIDAYIIISNNKDNESIEFINTNNGKSLIVSNEEIMKNNCNLNMMNYYKNSGYVKEIYRLKNNNQDIIDAIQHETTHINKLLDEYDINEK